MQIDRKEDLIISIVNWNGGQLLLECLQSVYENTKNFSFRVYVVDNNSSDGSIGAAERLFPQVKFIKSDINRGYACGHNEVIVRTKSKYVLLLNPDCMLLGDTIFSTLRYMDTHWEVGVAGCKVIDPWGRPQSSAMLLPTLQSEFIDHFKRYFFPFSSLFRDKRPKARYKNLSQIDQPIQVECIGGPFLLLRRKMLEEIGLLEESFFLFSEENDLCARAKKAGWQSVFIPSVEVVHHTGKCRESAHGGVSDYHFYRSRLLYFRKHHGVRYSICCAAMYSFFLSWSLFASWLGQLVLKRVVDRLDGERYWQLFPLIAIRDVVTRRFELKAYNEEIYRP